MKKDNKKSHSELILKDLKNQFLEDRYELKRIAHYYGCDDFLELLAQTLEEIGNGLEDCQKDEAENYKNRSFQIKQLLGWEE